MRTRRETILISIFDGKTMDVCTLLEQAAFGGAEAPTGKVDFPRLPTCRSGRAKGPERGITGRAFSVRRRL